jgi:hypothetical protein
MKKVTLLLPMLKKSILEKVQRLGGTTDKVQGVSLLKDLPAIKLKQPLYPRDTYGEELYGIDEFFEKYQKLYVKDKADFFERLLKGFFSKNQPPRGHMVYVGKPFTPLKKGSKDYADWHDWFEDEADLSEINNFIDDKVPEFVQIADSFGYPDHFYVCVSDPKPSNPTVFGTDHEVFFIEISNRGNLETFFDQFLTKDEFLAIVQKHLEGKVSEG